MTRTFIQVCRTPAFAWLAGAVIVVAVTLPNLGLWPMLLQDEVQIIDLGRVLLNPDTDWGAGWLVQENTPRLSKIVLGTSLQEWAYDLLLPSITGARVSALAGAVVASFFIFGWLRSRGATSWFSVLLALAFLLDPIFNESYRQGRVDSWAFAASIAACWAMSAATRRVGEGNGVGAYLLLAGALCSVAYFTWPTTLALMPLVLVEVFRFCIITWHADKKGWVGRTVVSGTVFISGTVLAFAVCLVPLLPNWESLTISSVYGGQVQRLAAGIQQPIIDLFVLHSPFVLPALVLSVFFRREIAIYLAMALAIFMMYQTMLYPMRVLYLLPYFAAIIAGVSASSAWKAHSPLRKGLFIAALSFLLAGNAWVSAVKRPLLATFEQEARATTQINDGLAQALGAGQHRILTTEWEVYHAARALGWKTYIPFGSVIKSSEEFKAFMDSMDYAVIREKWSLFKPVNVRDLEKAGFRPIGTVSFTQPDSPGDFEKRLFGIDAGQTVYDDLTIYGKDR